MNINYSEYITVQLNIIKLTISINISEGTMNCASSVVITAIASQSVEKIKAEVIN